MVSRSTTTKNNKLNFRKLIISAVIVSVVTHGQAANAGLLSAFLGGVVGYYIGNNQSSSSYVPSYSSGSYESHTTYVDEKLMAEATLAAGKMIASAIKDQPNHSYERDDQLLFNEQYHLDLYGKAIGIDLGSAEARKIVNQRGKIYFQEIIEKRLVNLHLDVVLAASVARALQEKEALVKSDFDSWNETPFPFRSKALVKIIDWARSHPDVALPQEILNEPVVSDEIRGSITKAQEISIAKIIFNIAGEAAKKSRGFGNISYKQMIDDESVAGAILDNAADWHRIFSKDSMEKYFTRIDETISYCENNLQSEINETKSFFAAGRGYTYSSNMKIPLEYKAKALKEILSIAKAKSNFDDMYHEGANINALSLVSTAIKTWKLSCGTIYDDQNGKDALKVLLKLSTETEVGNMSVLADPAGGTKFATPNKKD
jgi:hypothetical protein